MTESGVKKFFSTLTPEQQKAFCYTLLFGFSHYAFYNRGPSVYTLTGIAEPRFEKLKVQLEQKGFLTHYYYSSLVPANLVVPGIWLAAQHYNEMFKQAVDFGGQSTPQDAVNLIDKFIRRAPSKAILSNIDLPFDQVLGILPFPELWGTMALLSSDCLFELGLYVARHLQDDAVSTEFVAKFDEVAQKKLNAIQLQLLADNQRFCNYYNNGVFTTEILQGNGQQNITTYTLQLMGVRAVNMARYDEAVKLFAEAMKGLKKVNPACKTGFEDPITNYFLTMAYFWDATKNNNQASLKKLNALTKKASLSDSPVLYTAAVFGRILTSRDRMITSDDVFKLRFPELLPFKCLLISHFQTKLSGVKAVARDLQKMPCPMPKCMILQHELEAYLQLSPEEKQRLNDLYGTHPALTSIEKKEPWQLALDEMVKERQQEAEKGPVATKNVRIIYLFKSTGYYGRELYVKPHVQKWLKSGRWGAPAPAPIRTFADKTLEGMDEIDFQLADMVDYSGYIEIEKALPILRDTKRLFADVGVPMEIDEVPLEVIIEKALKIDGFEVKTNVDIHKYAVTDYKPMFIDFVKPNTLKVIKIDSRQQWDYVHRLLEIGTFPSKAETELKKALPFVAQTVRIDSPLLEVVKTVDGGDKLALQLTPGVDGFLLRVMAMPLPENNARYVPGEGQRECVVIDNDETINLYRHLRRERRQLERLQESFDADYDIEISSDITELNIDESLKLVEYATAHPDHVQLEWPKGQALRLLPTPHHGAWHISLKSHGGWFEVEGDVQINESTKIDIAQFLQNIGQSAGEFVALGKDQYIRLDKNLRNQLRRLEAAAVDNGHGAMQIGALNAATLADKTLNGDITIAIDDTLAQLRKRVADSSEWYPSAPRMLKADLREYQREGYQWISRLASWGAGACLADDMGLGKTVQAIAFMLELAHKGPILVVAPSSVTPNWRNEIHRFAPSLPPKILNTALDRAAMVEQATAGDVILCTYGLLHIEREILTSRQWNIICLDEAHTIKNRNTAMSQAAMELKAEHKLILTGTPIQNHLGELWNLFHFLNPTLLGPFERFNQKYIVPIEQYQDEGRRRQLKRLIAPFILRRTKAEVASELPEKLEITIPVELTADERTAYEALRLRAQKALEDELTNSVSVSALAEITRLRRCADSPALVNAQWTAVSSKTQALLDLISEIGEGGQTLVFSQFTSYLAIVRQALEQRGIPYLYLDGTTPMARRERLVHQFQNGECPLFLISLKAGGLGLNLTAANYVVHLDPWWNPAIEDQATDRAHRIGQRRSVTAYHLIAEHTIEEKIMRMHAQKRDLAQGLLEGTAAGGKLTREQLLEMLATE